MKLTPTGSVAIALLLVMLAATSVADETQPCSYAAPSCDPPMQNPPCYFTQLPSCDTPPPMTSPPCYSPPSTDPPPSSCYSEPSTAPPTTTCPDLTDWYAAVATAAANAQAAANARFVNNAGERQAKNTGHDQLTRGLNAEVTEKTDKLSEAKRKSDEIVTEVNTAANEAADSAREAASTKEECTRTVMLEMHPTWRPGCSESLNNLDADVSAGSQMGGALDFCANSASVLASYMIKAGDACEGNIDACNDIQNSRAEAQQDLHTIDNKGREGHGADGEVMVNMILANGLMGECASAADSAAAFATSAAGCMAAALQDQANGEIYYQAAVDAYAKMVSTFAAKCAADLALLEATFALTEADAKVATAQSASDACYTALNAAAECNKMSIQMTCSQLAGELTMAQNDQILAVTAKADAEAALTKATNDHKAARTAAATAWTTAQTASAHTTDTKVLS